eukprot:CAMPEP_0194319684 /NCGR_PEP_ID=MMETSP0171-20130528/16125_1 /TAXON_ID=218684 /ORGANISM="Corethron pennatum, Strain L29A3" /LENGTH=196 /DNA_ID=CAMNT_0039077003 /DNA_START=90 /DNA_END=676 /DNA_ORIENTATION=+
MRNFRLFKEYYGKDLPFQHSRKKLSQSWKSESIFDGLPQSPKSDSTFLDESFSSVENDEKDHQFPLKSSEFECHSPYAESLNSSLRYRINIKLQKPKWFLKFQKRKLRKKRELELALQPQDSIHTNGKNRREVFRLSGYEDPGLHNGYNGLVFIEQQNVSNMGPIKESVSIICEKIDLENGEDAETPKELFNTKDS